MWRRARELLIYIETLTFVALPSFCFCHEHFTDVSCLSSGSYFIMAVMGWAFPLYEKACSTTVNTITILVIHPISSARWFRYVDQLSIGRKASQFDSAEIDDESRSLGRSR